VSLNSVEVSGSSAAVWTRGACAGCMSEKKDQSEKDKKSFENKPVMIMQLASNAPVPDSSGNEEDANEGGVLVSSTARRSSRGSAARGQKTAIVSSGDMLGKLRLQLYQEHNFSPLGQRLYLGGVELSENESTLESLGVTAGCTIHLQNDKRGASKAEKTK